MVLSVVLSYSSQLAAAAIRSTACWLRGWCLRARLSRRAGAIAMIVVYRGTTTHRIRRDIIQPAHSIRSTWCTSYTILVQHH